MSIAIPKAILQVIVSPLSLYLYLYVTFAEFSLGVIIPFLSIVPPVILSETMFSALPPYFVISNVSASFISSIESGEAAIFETVTFPQFRTTSGLSSHARDLTFVLPLMSSVVSLLL